MLRYNINDFWARPIYLPYLQKELTFQAIIDCESSVGHKLPRLLLKLLTEQNGGSVNSIGYSGIDSLAGIGEHYPNISDLTEQMRADYSEFETDKLVALDGDGHYYICLDYRKGRSIPCISYIDFECQQDIFISDTIESYLTEDYLVDDELEDFEYNMVYSMERSVQYISNLLQEKRGFNSQDKDKTHSGFEYVQLSGGSENICRLSRNKVRRGFIRDTDAMYNDLKDIMPELVSRYKEVDGDSTILTGLTVDDEYEILKTFKENNIAFTEIIRYN